MTSTRTISRSFIALLLGLLCAACGAQDWRNIETGLEIPAEGYADMPLVVTLNDGSWLCTLTTGPGREGAPGQYAISVRSTDQGQTWSEPVPISPRITKHGSESSWVVPLHVPHQGSEKFGRVYAFYVTNGDNITEVPGLEERDNDRVDMLGWYVSRFSDDAGETWSAQTRIDIPKTDADLNNTFGGKVQMFWGVDEPITTHERTLIALTKIRTHLVTDTEGWLLACDNLTAETDPAKHEWRLLPMGNDGDPQTWKGLRSETNFRTTQAEHDLTALNKPGHFILINRTDTGVLSISRSTDDGSTWSEPEPMTYPDGSAIRNPRANAKVWKTKHGRYLLWFHNHGGTRFEDRNPGWLAGGIEHDGQIKWSQPEIALYHNDPSVRISYPDLIEDSGRYWITETEKETARVHEIDSSLIEGLWAQLDDQHTPPTDKLTEPASIDLGAGQGFSIALAFSNYDLATLSELASSGDERDGWTIRAVRGPSIEIELRSEGQTYTWQSDRVPSVAGKTHHAVITFDSGPAIVTMTINGKVHDGAGKRQFGWGRFPRKFPPISLMPSQNDDIQIFARALRTSEAVELYEACRASLPSTSRTR